MGRPRLAEPRDKPVLIRLTTNEMAVLKATAYVHDMTEAACAHQQLVEWLRVQATDRAVIAAINARELFENTEAETHSIADARELRPKGSTKRVPGEAGSAG
jgi:hypothetical protein